MAWTKRLSAANAKERKSGGKFIVSQRSPHRKSESMPLLVALRDEIKLVETYKEGKQSIKRNEVLVDGKICTDHKFGVGLFDTVSIPSASLSYRILPGKKGLLLSEIPQKESNIKICKITGKTVVKGGKIQYNLHDGRNMLSEKSYRTNDSLAVSLPEQKIIEHLKFEEGSAALVISGKNTGIVARIEKIESGRKKRVWLKKDSELFETPLNYVIIIGKDKPVITCKIKG